MRAISCGFKSHQMYHGSFVKVCEIKNLNDSWKDNRRFRCIVVRSIDLDMVVSQYNNNYLIGATKDFMGVID